MNFTIKQALRATASIGMVFLLGACVRLGHIQREDPIRTLEFTGSHKAIAGCAQQRVGGKVQDQAFGSSYVVYDSVKGAQRNLGITHYSITFADSGNNRGVATLRFVSARGEDMMAYRATPIGGGAQRPDGPVDAAFQKYWTPVVNCAAQTKTAP